jgi:coenzyme Q-binding protein COQ10
VLPYAPDQLFTLVGDVERYPEFVPWITHMSVVGPRAEGEGVDRLEAEAGVGFAFLQERFCTGVRRDAGALTVEVSLIRGPFKALSNRWRFVPEGAGTRVVFDIDFAFKSRLLDMVLTANFDRAVDKLIGCFETRAAQLYGMAQTAD